MEFNWLKDFVVLAACRNFSRAAEERHVSQPAFSRRIRTLETAVGARLINRDTLPLSLTPAGDLFLSDAKQMLKSLDDTIERCQAIDAEDKNIVRLAASQSLYTTYYSTDFQPFVDTSELTIELESVSWPAEKFVTSLQQGYCDLVLSYWHEAMGFLSPLELSQFEHLTLYVDRFIPVSKPDTDGTPMFRLGSAGKNRIPLISYGAASVFRPLIDELLTIHSGTANTLLVSQNALSSSVKALVLEGFGVGWLPARFCEEELNGGHLVPAGERKFEAEIAVRMYRSRLNTKPRLSVLWDALAAKAL